MVCVHSINHLQGYKKLFLSITVYEREVIECVFNFPVEQLYIEYAFNILRDFCEI